MGQDLLNCVEAGAGDDATASIIWLHGLGDTGHGFAGIVPALALPRLRYVFPHAPQRPVTINGGMVMPSWYDILHFGPGPDRESLPDVQASALQISRLIDRERDEGIPDERIILAGFSQGGAVALHVGLRHQFGLAGILCLSCYLLAENEFPACIHPSNATTPIAFHHGQHDSVVPISRGRASYEAVVNDDARRGQPPRATWADYPMDHEVCQPELYNLRAWILQRLPGVD